MKNLHFIVQAKGGVGKSILMYLFALKHYQDPKCLFIDVDASTQTSTRQLKFVHQDQSDVASLLDEKGLLIRDNLLAYLQSIAKEDFEEAYFDFGAPESEQLPALIEYDIPLKDFAEGLGFEITFHIVIGGGGAYNPSIDYLLRMFDLVKTDFEIVVWQSMATFRKFPHLTQELRENCKDSGLVFRRFGDFEPESFLGAEILTGIRKGLALDTYTIGPRLRLQRELQINFANV